MLTVEVLGAVQAHRDGLRLEVPAGKTSELLARLALEAGSPVRTDALLDDLWDGPAGRNTLQSKVSQLRRALGSRDLVVGSDAGYALAVPADAVDATRAVALASASASARAAGDPAASLEQARAGLALFRGEVLVAAGSWAAPHRTRLEEVRLGLVEDAMAAQVDLGAGSELVGELESLVAAHPLRERLWVALVSALYRAGRQADALAAYTRVRRTLVDELGVEPGPELRELEQRVLVQDPGLRDRAAPRSPGNLPAPAGALVGRVEEGTALVDAVTSHPVVTVTGPAGVGKTRLALDVGHRLSAPGGVWLVRLDAAERDTPVVQTVAETLHVAGGAGALRERLAGADTVLLLDNCEHVVAGVAAFVETLRAAVPTLRVLATSQVPLGLDGEAVHPLAPLPPDESVALFATRAQALQQRFVLDDANRDVVEAVCRSLDGLPLAIELAASRVRSLSVRDIARRLDDRFTLLRDPTSHRPERRRALDAAIAWSYELLFPDDQRGLWALSCFAGSASLDAVEQVLGALDVPRASVLDTVGRLVARSLVELDLAPDGEARYRLLDSIRAYASARLAEAGPADVAARAHAEWYAQTAARCDEQVRSARQPECLAVARAERGNLDEALAWCARHDPLLGARTAVRMGWTWVVLGDGTAGAGRVRQALHPDLPLAERAVGLLLAGWLEASAGDVALAQADLDEARSVATGLADPLLLADVDRHQAFVSIQQGRPESVLAAARSSIATYRPLDEDWRLAGSLLLAAYGSLMLGDTATAAGDATEAADLLHPIGDSWGMVHAQAMLGGIAQAEHRFDDAARALERAADESARMGFPGQAALHRATLARVLQRAGDGRAAATYERAIGDAVAGGDGRLAATARLNLARLLRADGDPGTARTLLEENRRWYRSAGGGDYALLTRCLLAALRDDAAGLGAVLEEGRSAGRAEVQVYALDALARLAGEAGEHDRAKTLLAEADGLAADLAHVMDPSDRLDAALARA